MNISKPISYVSFPVLCDFKQVNFESISQLGLMNRIDTKFAFPSYKIDQVLRTLTGKYLVFQRNEHLSFKYVTVYFDTQDFRFFQQHLRGELARNKVRYRNYEYTGDSFLEIKKKNNKGRTMKWRIPGTFSNVPFRDEENDFLKEHLHIESSLLKPVIISRFSRTTFINYDLRERLTIDYDISFESVSSGKIIELPYLSVAEVKKEYMKNSSPFSAALRSINIHPVGFSKYCMGNALLNNSLKINALKPNLLLLKKIENGFN